VSMDASFCGGSNETRPLIRMFEVSIDAPFHGGSNDTIGSRIPPQWPEILLSSYSSVLVLATWFAICRKNIPLLS
jgi:hypothetical protein